ncbi:ferredoxin--NADP reductase [Mycobacteroides abscessus]|nr:ferredoxin--NADP reductase [Mycobacteroides abscessus]MDM2427122.1 ferredoxin--NADP reductase [Mycobacteroides abscessus]MDM2432211.1 ferredoxin--NADP reductase [Mycobacteroides abscessus]MDM2436728.1 ferredoxin--NADP reductase [Mycobacteroides abscessus]MDM2438662.1 ferredoxin--NADP reductase [Mycobacteroides abscessus]
MPTHTVTSPGAYALEVLEVIAETPDAVSIVFAAPQEFRAEFAYKPGQFLTLRVPAHPDADALSRCYSLSSAPGIDEHLKVTVKRTAGGRASNWLCDNARAGMVLESLRPAGTFTMRDSVSTLVFVAAGSGITPIMSMIRTVLSNSAQDAVLVYANRDRDSVIFDAELAALQAAHENRLTVAHWIEAEAGLPTADGLRALLPDPGIDASAYLCGPTAFMEVATDALGGIGLARENIHREVFVSLTTDAFAAAPPPLAAAPADLDAVTAAVEIDGETHQICWPKSQILLDVLLGLGVDAPYVCREGNCGGCSYTLREGEVTMRVNDVLDDHEIRHGARLACQSLPQSDQITISFNR